MCWLDKNFKDTFPKPPMTAFTNHKNIKSLIIKAKVYPENPQRKQRLISGMFPCKMPCLICPFVKKLRKISGDQFTWQIRIRVSCDTSNVVYLIECNKDTYKQRYIGETERTLQRISDHKTYINSNIYSQPTGQNFNLPEHDISNMNVNILKKVWKVDEFYRKERERYLINKFNTFKNGLNKQR